MSRFLKIILWALGCFLFLLVVSAASLPSLVSTNWGKEKAVGWINSLGSGKLSVESVDLNWFGKQHFKNLVYEKKNGNKILSVGSFHTDTSLLYLLFGGRQFGDTFIEKPYVAIDQSGQKKELSFPRNKIFKSKKKSILPKQATFNLPQFENKFILQDGTFVVNQPNDSPIIFDNIQIDKEGLSKGLYPQVYHLHANTTSGETQGEIEIDFSLSEMPYLAGKVSNFPIAFLDFLSKNPFYCDSVGKFASIDFNFSKDHNQQFSLAAQIKSANLEGVLKGETKEGKLHLSPESKLRFTITPKLFHALLPESQKDEWALASPSDFIIEINQGIFPLNQKKFSFKDIVLQAKGSTTRAEINHKTLNGYSLNNFQVELTSHDNLQINYEGEIQGKESTALAGNVSVSPKGDLYFKSKYDGFPVSLVSLFSPPIEQNIRVLVGHIFDLETEGTYINGKLVSDINLTAPNLTLKGKLSGDFDEFDFTVEGDRLVTGKGVPYLGKHLQFHLNGLLDLSDEDKISIPRINGKITSPYFVSDIKGKLGGGHANYSDLQLVATGHITALPFNEQFPDVTLKNGAFFINLDGSINKIYGQTFINTQTGTDKGIIDSKALQAKFEIADFIQEEKWDFSKSNVSFDCDFSALPLALLNPFAPDGVNLTTLFGSTASLQAKGTYTPTQKTQLSLDFNAKGEGLDASFAINLENAQDGSLNVQQSTVAYIKWDLTPKRYQALVPLLQTKESSLFQLTQPTSLTLSVKEFTSPTTRPKNLSDFLCHIGFVGDIKVGMLSFRSMATNEYLVIDNISGVISGENFSKEIDFNVRGDVFAQNIPKSEKSTFEFKGNLKDFWTPQGKVNREGLTLDGELNVELLPVRQITGIFPMSDENRQLIQAVLGELMNARVYGTISQLTGPLTVDIKSSNFKGIFPIMLNPHAIYLRDSVEAEFTLTESVNQTLIKDINPLLIAGAQSYNPIKVYIDPQGFAIPIRPYFFQGVRVDHGIVDIGKIRVRNGGQIQMLMEFLKAKGVTPEGDMDAWFTPIYFRLHDGAATYQRFDALLAHNVHIAMWGGINLINNQVRMTLAISPSTLQEYYNVKNLSSKEMFQIKMRGTTNNLDLDWSSAYKRIAFIIARSATGQIGNIVGGILEQLVSSFGDESSPPPTTYPFPWER